jgi:hypothetical protein
VVHKIGPLHFNVCFKGEQVELFSSGYVKTIDSNGTTYYVEHLLLGLDSVTYIGFGVTNEHF